MVSHNDVVYVSLSEEEKSDILGNIETEIKEEREARPDTAENAITPITAKHFCEAGFSKYLTGSIEMYDADFWAENPSEGYLFGSNAIIYGRIVEEKNQVMKMNLSIRKDKIRVPAMYVMAVTFNIEGETKVALVGWKSALELKKSKRKDRYYAITSNSLNKMAPLRWKK